MIRTRTFHRVPWLAISLAIILSMGCGVLDSVSGILAGGETATPQPQSETPSSPALEAGTTLPVTSEGLETLESYRMFYAASTTWEGDEGPMAETESLEYALIRPWDAQYYYYDLQTTDPNTVASPWAGYQFGEEFFELDILPESNLCYLWNTVDRSLDEIQIYRLEDNFESVEIGELVQAEELVNDVYTDHYRVSNVAIRNSDLTSASGEIWIERGTGYIARFTGAAEGLFETMWDGDNGRFEWEYSITESGKVENIALPDECQEENLGNESPDDFIEISVEEIPIPEDAYAVDVYGDTITFESPSSPQDTADYYEFELARLGWELSEDGGGDEDLFMYTFQLDERLLEVIISYNDEDGSSVIITETTN